MSWVRIHPECQETMNQNGLASAGDFLRLSGVILCGHPDRHVLRVDHLAALLKKEHRVPWRDRLGNAWAGFGLVSKSTREANTLVRLAQAGIPCPQVLAYGEERGQAFLLLREEAGLGDMRHFVQQHPDQSLQLARLLGRCLARLHDLGYQHGDLYSKHVLVGRGPRLCLIDWQRCRRRLSRSWRWRCRDLATLDATLEESLIGPRMRLACLRSYLDCQSGREMKQWTRRIRSLSLKYQRSPRARELRLTPLAAVSQNLLWLDGEALCVTPAYREELNGEIPDWLRMCAPVPRFHEITRVSLGPDRVGQLERRTTSDIRGLFLSWLKKKPLPEVHKAALLFRLERHGIPSPKLLAFGRKQESVGRHQSFILSETPPPEETLHERLRKTAGPRARAPWLRQAGALLRRLHEAGYSWGHDAEAFAVGCALPKVVPCTLMLTRVESLVRRRQAWPRLALLDLSKLANQSGLPRTDKLRFFLGYAGSRRLTAPDRALAKNILTRQESAVRR